MTSNYPSVAGSYGHCVSGWSISGVCSGTPPSPPKLDYSSLNGQPAFFSFMLLLPGELAAELVTNELRGQWYLATSKLVPKGP